MVNGARAGTITYPSVPPGWEIVGTGDFDVHGKAEILWRFAPDNSYFIWRYADTGSVVLQSVGAPGASWRVVLIGDFDGDGAADLLWRDDAGTNAIWPAGDSSKAVFPPGVGVEWTPIAAGRYAADARNLLLWQRTDGVVAVWRFGGGLASPTAQFLTGVPASWQAVAP